MGFLLGSIIGTSLFAVAYIAYDTARRNRALRTRSFAREQRPAVSGGVRLGGGRITEGGENHPRL